MGRKKKIIEEPKEEKTNQGVSLGYVGTVKAQIKVGNKLYGKPKVFHNQGWGPLFKYVCQSLATDFPKPIEAPRIIRIFSLGDDGDLVNGLDVDNFNNLVTNANTKLRSLIDYPYTGSPLMDFQNTEASVTFKFTIPFSALNGYSDLNMLAFYSDLNKSINTDASAYIIVTKEGGTKLSNLIKDIGLTPNQAEDNRNQYNLFIEWTMTFKNT